MRFLLSLILLLAAPAVLAQPATGTLEGRVVDAEAAVPLAGASVAVWAARDSALVTGAITDGDGRFRIEGLRSGRYYVVASYVGYASGTVSDVSLESGTVDVGTLALGPDEAQLGTVEVEAERARMEVQIDRTVYRVSDDPLVLGGTATDALETLPSIDVDLDGNVSLRGVSNVAILINGRPAPVSSDFIAIYLQQLPAGSIDRIEVLPNPSARFEPEGMGGIINIVLKENTELGLGVSAQAGVNTQGGYNGNVLVTLGRGPLNLSASYGLRQGARDLSGLTTRIYRDLPAGAPLDPVLEQANTDSRARGSHLGYLAGEYDLSAATTVNASLQASYRDGGEDGLTAYTFTDLNGAEGLAYERLADGEDQGWSGDLRLGLVHRFDGGPRGESANEGPRTRRGRGGRGGGRGRQSGGSRGSGLSGHALSVEARYNASENDGTDVFTDALLDGTPFGEERSQQDGRRSDLSLQADYVRPLGWADGGRLEIGAQSEIERSDRSLVFEQLVDGTFVTVPERTSDYALDEAVHAAYVQAAMEVGAWGFQLGLRGEVASLDYVRADGAAPVAKRYTSLYPSAFATYELAEGTTLRASYSRRVNRPNARALDPVARYSDAFSISVGNPDLDPEYIDALEAGVVRVTEWGSVTVTPYARRVGNAIRRIETVRDDGVRVRTYDNLASRSSYGVEAVTAFQLAGALEGLGGFVSLEGYQSVADAAGTEEGFDSDAFGWGGRMNLSYAVGDQFGLGDLALQGLAFYRAPMDSEQGRVGARTRVSLGLRQSLLDGAASLAVRVSDPFGSSGFSYEVDQPALFLDSERTFPSQRVQVTFRYTFGEAQRERRRLRQGGEGGEGGGDEYEDVE